MPFLITIFATLLAAPQITMANEAELSCREKYPVKNLTINFVEENTGHNPLQYLYRRCLTDARNKAMEARRIERYNERIEAQRLRRQQNATRLLNISNTRQQQAVERQQNTRRQFQTRDYEESVQQYVDERRSRRSIVNEAEGFDRVNAILRRMTGQQQADLCKSVKVISGVSNPCRRYGSYR